jgi:hypothetical protein
MTPEREWSSDWSRSIAKRQRNDDLRVNDRIHRELVASIRRYVPNVLKGLRAEGLAIELIATTQQRASARESGTRAAILLDVMQSLALYRILGLVRDSSPVTDIALTIAGCAGLAISDQSPIHCSALLSLTCPDVDIDSFWEESTLADFREQLALTLPLLLLQSPSLLVNGCLLGHEVAHLSSVHDDGVIRWCKAVAEESFAFAMQRSRYAQEPNFAELAQSRGQAQLPPDELEHLRQSLVTRPEHYEANRDRLVGEIACDVHGLFVTGRFLEQAFMHERDDPEKIELAYLPFAFTFFLLMWLADLHQAMIRWLKHWVEFGFDSAGTAGLSEMHFRKVAIVNALARHLCMTFIPEQFDTEEQFNKGRELIGATIGRFKECLDALIYMPVEIAVIRACKNVEGERVAMQLQPNAPPAWLGHDLGRLFGHENLRQAFDEEGFRSLTRAAGR